MLDQQFINKEPDWKFLDQILSAIVVKDQKNATDTDLMQVIRTVYERTYYRYALMWFEEKVLREKYENRIVEMRLEIEQLTKEVKELKNDTGRSDGLGEGAGQEIPPTAGDTVQGDGQQVMADILDFPAGGTDDQPPVA